MKIKADGTIDKYKIRLVIKEFKQQIDLNYFDTYSFVSRITSMWMLIDITVINKLKIH